MNKKSQDWMSDFKDFLHTKEISPPRTLERAILSKIHSELNPSLKTVAAKLFGLHAVAAGLVMMICPQLGVGALVLNGHGVMHFFMHFGPIVCSAACGAVFLSTSALLAIIFLKREELSVANRYRFLNVSLLATVTFAGLMLAGGEADRLSYLFWMVGAITMGWLTMRFGTLLRFQGSHILHLG